MTVRDFDARKPEDRRRVMGWLHLLRQQQTHEWVCGHRAGSACGDCHQALIGRANALAAENLALREENAILREQLNLKL